MKQYSFLLVLLLSAVLSINSYADDFVDAVKALNVGSFNNKIEAVNDLQSLNDERSLLVLYAMLEGRLLTNDEEAEFIIYDENTDTNTNPFTLEIVTNVSSDSFKKVRTNNRLRRNIRTAIASLELYAEDTGKRMSAAKNLINNSDASLVEIIRDAYEKESVAKIKSTLAIALALIDVNSDDQSVRLQSIDILSEAVDSEALAVLNRLSALNDDGDFLEQDVVVAKAAANGVKSIERKLSTYGTMENLFFGLSLGSVLLLAAVGLAITFGVMGVINMAHGEMIMLGAYTTYVVQLIMPNFLEWSLLVAIPAAFLVAGAVGILIERVVIRHLYGRPLETLLATFGISLILQQAVRSIFSPLNRQVITPDWMSGSFEINAALSLTYNRFYIIWFSLIVVAALMILLKNTQLGLQMRAVTQNRPMANAMGIRSSWVDALTFGLGSGIAGIAGVALSQLTNVGPNLGQAYIIDSFMVVVFGGVGNLFGTVFAAMSLGVINKFIEPSMGAVLGKILILVMIILFIQWRPRGLFALKGRAVED
ncbi:urea ABC transporter permease subunit UrtB [Aurantivibrio infirmus]